jgi:ligand-binding sensor domain-containing protein/tRNA A-37 threonylcarbamoyl transferase component Bud32
MGKIKNSFRRLRSILLSICLCMPLWSLDPAKEIGQYNVEVYSTESGLPQSSILSIIQTSDGYLWLATYEGIARFDGVRFIIFDKTNTPAIESNRIRCLFEDSRKDVWAGTSDGLLNYHGGTFKNYTTADGLSSDFILDICEDNDGNIWVGTTNGVNRFSNGVFSCYKKEQGLSHNYISTITADNDGNIWIGTSGAGLNIITREGVIKQIGKNEELTGKEDIRTLYKGRENEIWIGTGESGLLLYKNGSFRSFTQKDGLSGDDIRALFQDSRSVLWIGTNGQGLNRFKIGENVFSFFSSPEGLLNRPTRAIVEDHEENLWIGTRDGLCHLIEGKFVLYNEQNGLPVNSVRTIYQDSSGTIWLGTVSGGLVQFTGSGFKSLGSKEGINSEHIWTITEGRDGSIWVGTYGDGLHRLKNGKVVETFTTGTGLSRNIVRAVATDLDGGLWVGTNGGGVDLIKKGNITNYNSKNGLTDDYVYSIATDRSGDIWIGAFNGEINRFSGGKFTIYTTKDGLTGHAIWSIYPDEEEEGVIWVGTDGGGLFRFKDDKFTRFTVKSGLYSDLAFAVFGDRRGNLWMNCNRGIYKVRKKDLDNFVEGKIQKLPSFSFGRPEGIKSTECNGPAQPAGMCAADGKLWFPTIRGAVVIDPDNIKTNRKIPLVVIEEIHADGNILHTNSITANTEKTALNFKAGIQRFEFKYTALSFVSPGRVRFKYKLEGFEKKWMDGGADRRVSYTNIPPGDYTFRVKACNNDGLWNEKGAFISFYMAPFFWQTIWFKFILLAAFAVLSYLMINFIKKHMILISFWKKKKYIGAYEIDEQIGVGGMGIVYMVHSLIDTNKTYALKVLKEEYMLDEIQKKRFKNEALLVDRIDHPHIVKVHERGEDGEKLYITMELLEGETLAERYKKEEYPSISRAVCILAQVSDVLVSLHKENIIHRDLKPENIMLISKNNNPDYVKLLDFGIAKVPTFSHLTETGQILGTLPYMPPEVVSSGELSPSVDVYSLGIIAYEMLTQIRPFTGDRPIDTMKKIIHYNPPEPVKLNPEIPFRLNTLILRMIDKTPSTRPDAQEVLQELIELS